MKKINKKMNEIFTWDRKTMGYFFFGVGITMFTLNLTTVINAINLISRLNLDIQIPMGGYYISLVSSVILMTYSLYNIYIEEN